MKSLLSTFILIGTISAFGAELTPKCNVYQLASENAYTRYEKVDTLDLGKRSSEFGRPVKGLDDVGLRIRKTSKDTMQVLLVDGHNFTFPTKVHAELTANVTQRPLEIRLPVNGEMLVLNCGRIE